MEFHTTDNQDSLNTVNGLDNENSTPEEGQSEFGRYGELEGDDYFNQFDQQPYVMSKPEPVKKSGKEKCSIAFIILFILFIVGWCFLSGLNGLLFAKTHNMEEAFQGLVNGDVYEGNISYITPEVCELKHTVNMIPAGTEHFYLMFSEDGTKAVPIRVPRKWDEQYMGDSISKVALTERGIVREMDYKLRNELSSIVTDFQAEGIQMEPVLYIDLNTNRLCMLQIIAGVSLILCVLYFTLVGKSQTWTAVKTSIKNPIYLIMTVWLVVTLGMLIYLLNMVGF